MNKISKVTNRKTLNIVKSFTNGFAQTVYELEDGTMLFFNYHHTEVEIVETEVLETQQDVINHINNLPTDGEA